MEPGPVKVSERDREYMRRLGEFERENEADALREHLALSLIDRLYRSANLSEQWAGYLHDDRETEAPEEFYERARRLGLYRSERPAQPHA
jgi:hypothetical protein